MEASSSTLSTATATVRLCQGIECGGKNQAKFQCPQCVKIGTPETLAASHFCSQDCFKKSWATHKAVHGSSPLMTTLPPDYKPFGNFPFTGKLRPWPYGPKRTVPSHIKTPDYAEFGIPLSERAIRGNTKIKVLTAEEIKKMRTVSKMGREILDLAGKAVKAGVTADEIDRIVHEATIERNAYPSPLNYNGFPKSCCVSVNEVICHGIPDLRPFEDGDIVNIDVSVYYDGYHSDLNETYLVGNVDERGRKLVDVTRECLEKAIEICKPGTMYREIGNVIEKHATANKFSVVRTYCGHGVNDLFHTTPNIPHYAKNKAIGTMQAGHVFTIEPMINEGTWKDTHWPDNWTCVTLDGKRSAQFEHTLLITNTGCDILTR